MHDGQLIFARGNDQFLLPSPFVVEFVAVPDEKAQGLCHLEDGVTSAPSSVMHPHGPETVPGIACMVTSSVPSYSLRW